MDFVQHPVQKAVGRGGPDDSDSLASAFNEPEAW